jgi:hypothetical protein
MKFVRRCYVIARGTQTMRQWISTSYACGSRRLLHESRPPKQNSQEQNASKHTWTQDIAVWMGVLFDERLAISERQS